MNITEWLALIGGGGVLAAVAAFGCARWYQRKLDRLHQRFEQSRHAAHQFATQTKLQIAQLQKELAERPRRVERAAPADAAAMADRKRALEATLDESASYARKLPVDGFADTQPMQHR